jgi:muramidase (phage lysozyme)
MRKQEEERYQKEREEAKRLIENQKNLVSGANALKEAKKRARESARTSNLPDTSIGMDDMSRDFTKYPITGKAETEPTPESAEKVPQNFTAKQKLLEQIAAGEGTSEEQAKKRGYKSGYDVTLGYGKFDPKDANKPITEMTLDELDAFQTEMLKNPENKLNSSAVGKYQIVRTTLRELKEKLGLKGDEKFTPELQDKLASELLQRRGMGKFEKGEITQEQFQENLAKEWASIATKEGKSFYGQRVGTTSEEINKTIADLKIDKSKDKAKTLAGTNISRIEDFQPTAASSLSAKGFEEPPVLPLNQEHKNYL